MREEKYYLDILKQSMEKETSIRIKEEDLEQFKDLIFEQFSAFFRAYEEKEYVLVQEYLDTQRDLRKKLVKELSKSQEQILICASQFTQTFAVFNRLLKMENAKAGFAEEMKIVELNYRYAKDVLKYLYKHINVQHKTLCEVLEIPKSSLSDLMKVLERIGGIEVEYGKKATFYNLTNEARSYLKGQIEKEEEEEIIDPEVFVKDSMVLSRKKNEQIGKILLEQWDNTYYMEKMNLAKKYQYGEMKHAGVRTSDTKVRSVG